jgi:hypothetical protein
MEIREEGAAVTGARRHVHPAVILAVLATASFIATLDLFVVNVGLPEIGRGVGSDDLSNPAGC